MIDSTQDHKKHPIYVFGTGLVIGVTLCSTVLIYFQGVYYIKKDTINQHLEKQGMTRMTIEEKNKLINVNLCSEEVTAQQKNLKSNLNTLTKEKRTLSAKLGKSQGENHSLKEQIRELKVSSKSDKTASCPEEVTNREDNYNSPPITTQLSPGWILDIYAYKNLSYSDSENLPERPPNNQTSEIIIPLKENIVTYNPPVMSFGEFQEYEDIKPFSKKYAIGQYWHGKFIATESGSHLFHMSFKSKYAHSLGSAFCRISLLKDVKVIHSMTVRVTQNGPSVDDIIPVNLQAEPTKLGVWMLCVSQRGVNTIHFSKWIVTLKVRKPRDNAFNTISSGNELVHAN